MKVAVFSTHAFERVYLVHANAELSHETTYLEASLTEETVALAEGHDAVSCFVSDRVDRETLERLSAIGVRVVALRSAGYNHVDLEAADRLGITVLRVPAYSPHAVAEHAIALLLSLNRKIPRAANRVRDLNFSLDGLVGFDLFGKTVGVVGTGRIGSVAARILKGFGCEVLAFDALPAPALADEGVARYVPIDELLRTSDVISLHVPLTPQTKHLIDGSSFSKMKPGVFLINTSRGGLIDARALIDALKTGRIGGAALDVYEEEEGIFYRDLSERMLRDDVLARLLTFPNVLITSHQAFLTKEALTEIARATFANLSDFEAGGTLANRVRAETHVVTEGKALPSSLTS